MTNIIRIIIFLKSTFTCIILFFLDYKLYVGSKSKYALHFAKKWKDIIEINDHRSVKQKWK